MGTKTSPSPVDSSPGNTGSQDGLELLQALKTSNDQSTKAATELRLEIHKRAEVLAQAYQKEVEELIQKGHTKIKKRADEQEVEEGKLVEEMKGVREELLEILESHQEELQKISATIEEDEIEFTSTIQGEISKLVVYNEEEKSSVEDPDLLWGTQDPEGEGEDGVEPEPSETAMEDGVTEEGVIEQSQWDNDDDDDEADEEDSGDEGGGGGEAGKEEEMDSAE